MQLLVGLKKDSVVLTHGLIIVTGSSRAFVLSSCGCESRALLWKRKAVSDWCGSCKESADIRDSGGYSGEHPYFWGFGQFSVMYSRSGCTSTLGLVSIIGQ